MITISEVGRLWDKYCASDEPHDCPIEAGKEFSRCEVCDESMAALHKLEYSIRDIVQLLLKTNDCRMRMLRKMVDEIGSRPKLSAVRSIGRKHKAAA